MKTAGWIAAAGLLLLAGCAQQQLRQDAATELREGRYESAIGLYQEGVSRFPESAPLRAGLIAARNEAIVKLVSQSAEQRARGRLDEADRLLERAHAIEPGNERLVALRADLEAERAVGAALQTLEPLLAAGRWSAVEQNLRRALADHPRHPRLVEFQRRAARAQRATGGVPGVALAETRPVTLEFRNAPLAAVLEAVTRHSGINFILDRDVPQEQRVTIHLRAARVQEAIDLVVGAQGLAQRIVDPRTVLIYPNTPQKKEEHQEQVIRVFHLGAADVKSTAALLQAMLGIKAPFIDEKSNMLAIREAPELVVLAERLIGLHDQGEAEVMLEVDILEVRTSRLTELGIRFPNAVTLTPLPAPGDTGLTLGSLRGIDSDRIGVGIAGLLLNLNRETGDFNILANPRIRTKHREKAMVLVGDKVPVITSTATATGFISESISYLDVGLKLEVEPIVSPDNEVTIKLGLEVSSLAREIRTAGGSLAYQLGTRNAATTLRLQDGETQLLAGLISNEDRTTSNRLPGLGDLPVAGRLFSSQKDDTQRTELVLAITPRILRGAVRPDLSEAEMWIGTPLATRWRAPPWQSPGGAQPGPSAAADVGTTGKEGALREPVASLAPVLGPPILRWAGPGEVDVGQIFEVKLEGASGVALRGMTLELLYPAERLELVQVDEGPFFKDEQNPSSFTQAVDPRGGKLGIGVLAGREAGASGEGAIVTLRFKAVTAGSSAVSLGTAQPLSLEGAVGASVPADLKVMAK